MQNERDKRPDDHASAEPESEDTSSLHGDPVEEASLESFPASDPPAWEPLRSGPPEGARRRDPNDEAAP